MRRAVLVHDQAAFSEMPGPDHQPTPRRVATHGGVHTWGGKSYRLAWECTRVLLVVGALEHAGTGTWYGSAIQKAIQQEGCPPPSWFKRSPPTGVGTRGQYPTPCCTWRSASLGSHKERGKCAPTLGYTKSCSNRCAGGGCPAESCGEAIGVPPLDAWHILELPGAAMPCPGARCHAPPIAPKLGRRQRWRTPPHSAPGSSGAAEPST